MRTVRYNSSNDIIRVVQARHLNTAKIHSRTFEEHFSKGIQQPNKFLMEKRILESLRKLWKQ